MPPPLQVMRKTLLLSVLIGVHVPLMALRAADPELLTRAWNACWVTVPGASPYDYGVYHFRHPLDLAAPPIHVPHSYYCGQSL